MQRGWVMQYATISEAATWCERSRNDLTARIAIVGLPIVRVESKDLIPVHVLRAVERRLNEHDG